MNFNKNNVIVDYRNNYLSFITDWIAAIIESKKVIIVEGKKDKKALLALGIPSSQVLSLNGALYKVVDAVSLQSKEAIILTDFDAEGKKLYSALKKGLEKEGIVVDKIFREALRRYTKVSHIEGIK